MEFCRRFFLLPLAQDQPTSPTAVVPAAAASASSSASASASGGSSAGSASPSALLSGWFRPWLLLFGRELIELSAAHPLVSGFYKLLSVVFVLSDKFGYFDGLPIGFGVNVAGASDIRVKLELKDAAERERDSKMAVDSKEGKAVIDLTRDDTLDNRLFVYRLFSQFLMEVVTRIQTFKGSWPSHTHTHTHLLCCLSASSAQPQLAVVNRSECR